ncbi:MAG: hypothetical protein II322_04450 [Alistipes sp.]|nr:hypothetical protein [Alistipes sp.]
MKKLFSIFALLSLAVGFTACEEVTSDTPNAVTISADKSEITANGTDFVTFIVSPAEAQIICLNDNSVLTGTTFKTTTAGEYRFAAIHNGVKSNEVKVTAKALKKEVVLEADKSTIVGDNADVVTFTVTVDGQDKTAESTITIVNYGTPIEGNTFTTDVAGEFIFQANYDGENSNQVIITATGVEAPVQKSLTLTASAIRIKADGTESVTFKAMYGEEDVTATCTIQTTAGLAVEGGVFATTEVGTYNFYALYDNVRSNTVSVDAYDPNMKSDYEIGQIYDINGTKGVAYAIKTVGNDTFVYFFSMDEADLQWSTETVWCNCVSSKGAWNTYDPFDERYSQADGGVRDINNYPAFKWCMDHGADWFMPSSQELQWMWDAISAGTHDFDSESVKAYNKLLTDNGGMPFVETYYWSSNETAEDLVELVAFMNDSVVCLEPYKTYTYTVRAVYRILL